MANQNNSTLRPPIVTVMGHIDHGKTSLLDKIRSTNIWRKEIKGITQHIGAYQAVVLDKNKKEKLITFIDTPGHAAFINMRSRGAQVTDLVVLVIAATEGVMAQTKECLDHIKKAGLPFIVAMNKMDLEGAAVDKIKGQLVELGYTPEEYGGDVACIPVSAKTGQGIEELLDMILLHAELLDIKADFSASPQAFVIESKLDKRKGAVATAIVKQGTLKLGDTIYAGTAQAKIKAMINYLGQNIDQAAPGTPIEILGFSEVPAVGAQISREPQPETQKEAIKPVIPVISMEDATPRLPLVIKADTEGTLEAILGSFSDDVQIIYSGVGPVNDTDIFMAEPVHAQVVAFNVSVPKFIKNLASGQKVKIIESQIIYEILEEIESQVLKLLEPTIDETILSEATIKAEFKINKVRIAGINVTKGVLTKGDSVHLKRDNKIIKDTKIENIQQGKEVINSIKMGNECGLTFKPYVDFKINDVIISYNKS